MSARSSIQSLISRNPVSSSNGNTPTITTTTTTPALLTSSSSRDSLNNNNDSDYYSDGGSGYRSNKPAQQQLLLMTAYSPRWENRWAVGVLTIVLLTAGTIVRYRSSPFSGYGVGGDGDDEVPHIHALVHHKNSHRYPVRIGHHPAAAARRKKKSIHNSDNIDIDNSNIANTNPLSCEGMMDYILTNKIQLVALDFDKTILDIHTGGRWKHRSSELVAHVRPEMQCLISRCLRLAQQQDRPIELAVATFSPQKDLIQRVLQKSFDEHQQQQQGLLGKTDPPILSSSTTTTSTTGTTTSIATMIPVFGGDDWVKGYKKGKQSQLLLAMQYFNKNNDEEDTITGISPATTLLVDDDLKNIHIARADGYHTLLYRPVHHKI